MLLHVKETSEFCKQNPGFATIFRMDFALPTVIEVGDKEFGLRHDSAGPYNYVRTDKVGQLYAFCDFLWKQGHERYAYTELKSFSRQLLERNGVSDA